MSLPYFNMYPTDFEAKTSHLTLEEDGAYNRLLRLMWMTPGCSLPDDDKWIMRRMRVDQDTFDRVVSVILDEFFERRNGRVSNARLAREYAKSNDAHKKRVSAGKLGGNAKALKTKKNVPSNAKAKPYQPEPEPEPIKRDTSVSTKKRAPKPDIASLLSVVCSPAIAQDFVAHRAAMKKPITELAAKRIVDRLSGHQDPDAVLNLSIENGWQGIFPEKVGFNGNGNYSQQPGSGARPDAALENIARLAGLGTA